MSRPRLLRILRLFVVITAFLLAFVPFALGFLTIWLVTHTPCGGQGLPSDHGMPDYEPVTFYSDTLGGDVRGFFVRGSNGATIIIPPALGSGAGSWMAEYVVLNQHGYNLFNYEAPNCLGQVNTLGYREGIAVGDALNYLATRPDVDMRKIGIHGFSAGGAASIMAAARYPQIQAVIAMGGYHDFAATLVEQSGTDWYAPLYQAGARVSYRLATGLDISVLSPISVIDQVAPRPIQLIYGTREPALSGAYRQQSAAGDNADLWVITDATHGTYLAHMPESFALRVVSFLDAALGF
jgi:uncharacterized protein